MARRRRSGSDAGSASYWHVRPGEGAGNPAQPAGAHMRARPASPARRRPRSTIKSSAPSCRLIGPTGLPRPYHHGASVPSFLFSL